MAGHPLIPPLPAVPRVPDGQRVYVFGDVHGRADLFARLEANIRDDLKMSPAPRVTIVGLGDYVDRGSDSRGVIERAIGLRREFDAVFIRGNHEAMLQEARRVHSWRPDFLRGPILMAAALAALERPAEARQAIGTAQALWPKLNLDTVVPRFMPRFSSDLHHDRLLELLRAAGLPATG